MEPTRHPRPGLALLVGCCRAAAWWGNGIFSTAVSLVGVEPHYYAFWKYFVLLDSSSTTGGAVPEHFHAARATPALCVSVPLALKEQRVLPSPLQAVTCFHSMLKIMLFMPFVCVLEPPRAPVALLAVVSGICPQFSKPVWRLLAMEVP